MSELDGVIKELRQLQAQMAATLERFTAPTVPVSISKAAEQCECEPRWLLERVQRSEIPAFRSGEKAPWRVYVKDVLAFMTRESNQIVDQRQPRLKLAGGVR